MVKLLFLGTGVSHGGIDGTGDRAVVPAARKLLKMLNCLNIEADDKVLLK